MATKGKRVGNERMGDKDLRDKDALKSFYKKQAGVNAQDSPHKRRMDKISFDVQQLKQIQRKKYGLKEPFLTRLINT